MSSLQKGAVDDHNHFGSNWAAIHPSVFEPLPRSHGGHDGGGSGEHCAAERFPVIMGLRHRQAFLGKRRGKSAAPSQKNVLSDTHASLGTGYEFEYGEQYNYFCASRFEGLFHDVVGI